MQDCKLLNYILYKDWSSDNGYRPLSNKNFVAEIRKKYEVKRNGTRGNEVINIDLYSYDNIV